MELVAFALQRQHHLLDLPHQFVAFSEERKLPKTRWSALATLAVPMSSAQSAALADTAQGCNAEVAIRGEAIAESVLAPDELSAFVTA